MPETIEINRIRWHSNLLPSINYPDDASGAATVGKLRLILSV
jgi:hypothetical protein